MLLHQDTLSQTGPRLDMLGPFRLFHEGADTRLVGKKNIALLAYLARRGAMVPRESLLAMFWPDSGDTQARASLRQTLSSLRRDLGLLGPVILRTDADAVSCATAAVRVDVTAFDHLSQLDDSEALMRARDLWRGEFLEGIGSVTPEFDRWLDAERGALRAGLESVLLRLCDAHAADGRTEEVIATALRLLNLDPLQEHVHRRVMLAYRQQRRFDAAIRQFETLRGVLEAELGIPPEQATLDLVRDIRRQRGNPAVAEGPVALPAEPTIPRVTPSTPSARPSIAVLPFPAGAGNPDTALLGEGIAEEVIVNLARERALMVLSRQSSFHPEIALAAPGEIGVRLGVRFVLSGSVRASGNRIRVAAHLARCNDGAEIWAETYDREIGDIFAVQSEIARTVMATVVGRIASDATGPDTAMPAADLDAWRLCLRGLRLIHAYTPEGMKGAMSLLSQAVLLEPTNGRALGLLALATLYDRWNYALSTDVSDILPLAEQALAYDSRDSSTHCVMAVACLLARDYGRASHHFEAGLAVNPNDDLLLIEYGRYLFYVDRPEDALSRIREAMRLNPLHPDWYWNIRGRCLHLLGRHAEALQAFRYIATPAYYHFAYMAACHRKLGDEMAARGMRDKLFAAEPGFDVARFIAALPFRSAATSRRFAGEICWLDSHPRDPVDAA